MKPLFCPLLLLFLCWTVGHTQVSGNINYQTQVSYPDQNIYVSFPSSDDVLVSAKGLANIKADAYVAIFNTTQVGKTAVEVNRLVDERINSVIQKVKGVGEVETFVDMISFVPVYEYEIEKKIFSKNTYNEIPAGFELKKNIHIKYTDPALLNNIIALLSEAEIYDLVRVDYFSESLEEVKRQLMEKAKATLQQKRADYEAIIGDDLDSSRIQLLDGYKVVMPVERYQAYQAYNSSSLQLNKPSKSKTLAEKSTTLYYQPIIDKEFDFVINPAILEPVIQVMYEVKLRVTRAPQNAVVAPPKTYILVAPNGELKELPID